jgi:hypothetical protein
MRQFDVNIIDAHHKHQDDEVLPVPVMEVAPEDRYRVLGPPGLGSLAHQLPVSYELRPKDRETHVGERRRIDGSRTLRGTIGRSGLLLPPAVWHGVFEEICKRSLGRVRS